MLAAPAPIKTPQYIYNQSKLLLFFGRHLSQHLGVGMLSITESLPSSWARVPRGDWHHLKTEHKGEKGITYGQTLHFDGLRIGVVEYSAAYIADHWCEKGHIEANVLPHAESCQTIMSGVIHPLLSPSFTQQHKWSPKIHIFLSPDSVDIFTYSQKDRLYATWTIFVEAADSKSGYRSFQLC